MAGRARSTVARLATAGLVVVGLVAGGGSSPAQAQTATTLAPAGWSGVVSMVEHHVQPVLGSDATYQPVPFGTATGGYTFDATFSGKLDEGGSTTGVAKATFDESFDHDGYFCYGSTKESHGSGEGPVTLSGGPDGNYPLAVGGVYIPVRSVDSAGQPGCASESTNPQSVGGTYDPYLLQPEVLPTNPPSVLSGSRTYTDPPSVQNVLVPSSKGDGSYDFIPTTFTRTVTITWRLTRLRDRDHDGFPDTKDRCPTQFAPAGSTDGCPPAGPKPGASLGATSGTGATGGATNNRAPGPVVRPTSRRSTVVAAIPTVKDISKSGKVVLVNLILVAILMLLITFPAELFNSTLKEHYDEVRGWFRLPWNRGKPLAARPAPAEVPLRKRVATYLTFVVGAALLHGFLDPSFGLDAASATLVIGLVIGIPIVTLVASAGSLAYTRVKHGERGVLRAFPGTLVVALACVIVSRLAHFAPGYMYGLIAGFVFSRQPSEKDEGRRAAVAAAWVLVVSLVAWLILSPLQTHKVHGFFSFPWEIVLSSLTSVFLGGIEGMALGLVPLRSLAGEKVFRWSKTAWALLFGVTLFLFVHLLLHPQAGFGDAEHPTPLFTWLGLFVAFGLVSVLFWAYFRYRPARPDRELVPADTTVDAL